MRRPDGIGFGVAMPLFEGRLHELAMMERAMTSSCRQFEIRFGSLRRLRA